jgi:D-sedoheptulose 7-phosphate isomerase
LTASASPTGNGVAAKAPRDAVDAYLRQLSATVDALSRPDIWSVVDTLIEAGRRGRRIYIFGNGGSAATASHMANDLAKQASVEGHRALRAIALTDNVPLLTAWSNDEDYKECFARQLATHIERDDVAIGISTSGNSPNVLQGLKCARKAGAVTVGMTGRDGGALRALVDHCIYVPCDDIGRQEDVHLVVNHAIAVAVRDRLLQAGAGAMPLSEVVTE